MLCNLHANGLPAALIASIVFSGCQSPVNNWSTASKRRPANSASQLHGHDSAADVANGASRAGKDKFAKNTTPTANDPELAELLKEGDGFRKAGHYEEAKQKYTKGLAVSPDNPDIHHRLAVVADHQRQYSVADSTLR